MKFLNAMYAIFTFLLLFFYIDMRHDIYIIGKEVEYLQNQKNDLEYDLESLDMKFAFNRSDIIFNYQNDLSNVLKIEII